MRSPPIDRRLLAIALALLVFSAASISNIPFMQPIGIDLANLHAFHHCVYEARGERLEVRNDPYLVPGSICGDPDARAMFYPPLLYWSFTWVRLASLRVSWVLWSVAILLGMAALPLAWLTSEERRLAGRVELAVFWALMVVQFPVAFAVERGNSDVLIVLFWTASMLLFRAGKPTLAGAAGGLSVALKVYPILAVVAVSGALFFFDRRLLLRWLAGAIGGLAFAVALLPIETWVYVREVLPFFAARTPPQEIYSHSVPALAGRVGARLVAAALLALWSFAGARTLAVDPRRAFAGALAISTYFAATSYDYNLVTCYPLLVLCFVGLAARGSRLDGVLALGGIVAILAHRGVFEKAANLHVALQVGWLALAALGVSLGGSCAPASAVTRVLGEGNPIGGDAPGKGLRGWPPAPFA